MANSLACLFESAFSFSYFEGKIDFGKYEIFLKAYLEEKPSNVKDIVPYIYGAMNGKLDWFSYIVSKNIDAKGMIKELVTYYDNIPKFTSIYEKIENYSGKIR